MAYARWRKTSKGVWCAVVLLEEAPNIGEVIEIENAAGEVSRRYVSSYGEPYDAPDGQEYVRAYLKLKLPPA